jgi:hypothetical protein
VVGIDRGVVVSAALSTGELLHAPRLTPGESKRLKVLQQRLARAKRGSRRREETKRAIAKLKARERDRRKDWVEKTTTDPARRFDVIRVEDLDVRAMTRSGCGHVAPGNRKSQAVFECEACTADRCNADVNAARNIAAGRAVTARGDLAGRRSANREPQLSAPSAYVGGMGLESPDLRPGRTSSAGNPFPAIAHSNYDSRLSQLTSIVRAATGVNDARHIRSGCIVFSDDAAEEDDRWRGAIVRRGANMRTRCGPRCWRPP